MHEIDVSHWAKISIWSIAPAGLDWITEGSRLIVGRYASIGAGSSDAIDIGWADGYRKCIAQVNGIAYIGAGCRWFTLADALAHWSDKENRKLTMCLMRAAVAIADEKGWKHG